MNTDKEIRRILRELRESRNISQAQMAAELGIRPATYGSVENGPTEIIYKHLPAIARILGVSMEEILLGYEPYRPSESELRSETDHQERLAALRDDYENRLEIQRKEIESLKNLVEELKEDKKRLSNFNDFLLPRVTKND